MTNTNMLPGYQQDETFDENNDIDFEAIRTLVIIVFTASGCFIAALGLGIYYFIINNF